MPIPLSPIFPVIFGPTASGKSALAVALAHRLATLGRPAEVVTADAFQVYRGMDIGTAKPTPAERAGLPHHMLDVADPHEPSSFTVDQWLTRASAVIDDIRARGCLPIVVGGTSLYIQSLLFGLFDGPPADERLRAELRELTPEQRRAELTRIDPAAAGRILPSDERRTIRAIEVFRITGRPISDLQQQWEAKPPRPDARLVVLDWPVPALNQRINARVSAMRRAGLVDEVRRLLDAGPLNLQAREALGYKQLLPIVGDRPHAESPAASPRALDDAFEQIKILTRRLGKAQRTWQRRLQQTPGTIVLPGEGALDPATIAALADAILASGSRGC